MSQDSAAKNKPDKPELEPEGNMDEMQPELDQPAPYFANHAAIEESDMPGAERERSRWVRDGLRNSGERIDTLSKEIARLSQKADNLAEDVEKLSERTDSLSDRTAGLAVDVSVLSERLDSLTQNVKALSDKVDALSDKTSALAQDLAALTARVNGLSEKVDAVAQDVKSLRQEVRDGFQGVDEKFLGVDEKFLGVDEKFQHVDEKFQHVDNMLQRLWYSMMAGFQHQSDLILAMSQRSDDQFAAIHREAEKQRKETKRFWISTAIGFTAAIAAILALVLH